MLNDRSRSSQLANCSGSRKGWGRACAKRPRPFESTCAPQTSVQKGISSSVKERHASLDSRYEGEPWAAIAGECVPGLVNELVHLGLLQPCARISTPIELSALGRAVVTVINPAPTQKPFIETQPRATEIMQ